mmetsp:Transcript_19201/g.46340  ORF Transcript_19201/g.46340 Transcript_19201/m.46340 type:complete len:111 (-) Transcript_19201:1261-1593(-)
MSKSIFRCRSPESTQHPRVRSQLAWNMNDGGHCCDKMNCPYDFYEHERRREEESHWMLLKSIIKRKRTKIIFLPSTVTIATMATKREHASPNSSLLGRTTGSGSPNGRAI